MKTPAKKLVTKPKPRIGRPPGPRGRESAMVGVRLSKAEKALLGAYARILGVTPAEALRQALFLATKGKHAAE